MIDCLMQQCFYTIYQHPTLICSSLIFVCSILFDITSCSCQSKIMIKTLLNLVWAIWSKTKISSNIAAEENRQEIKSAFDSYFKFTNETPPAKLEALKGTIT